MVCYPEGAGPKKRRVHGGGNYQFNMRIDRFNFPIRLLLPCSDPNDSSATHARIVPRRSVAWLDPCGSTPLEMRRAAPRNALEWAGNHPRLFETSLLIIKFISFCSYQTTHLSEMEGRLRTRHGVRDIPIRWTPR